MIINIEQLLAINLKDEVIIFETDTVYGIGCLLNSELGVRKIREIKKREEEKPLAVLCGNLTQVKMLVNDFERYKDLADKYWPGAVTLVFEKTGVVSGFVTSSFDTVGVRIPNNETALKILEKFGPMAVTSLNISSMPSILKYADTLGFENHVDYIVEGKDLSSISSTVFDCVNNKVLRQGEIIIG